MSRKLHDEDFQPVADALWSAESILRTLAAESGSDSVVAALAEAHEATLEAIRKTGEALSRNV
jgi:hypothetical protein